MPRAHAEVVIARSTYAIEIRGRLPSSLAAELVEFDIADRERSTILTGELADGAALYGLLARFESLGVQLLSVHPITEPPETS
jgi:hypothetical protein